MGCRKFDDSICWASDQVFVGLGESIFLNILKTKLKVKKNCQKEYQI